MGREISKKLKIYKFITRIELSKKIILKIDLIFFLNFIQKLKTQNFIIIGSTVYPEYWSFFGKNIFLMPFPDSTFIYRQVISVIY